MSRSISSLTISRLLSRRDGNVPVPGQTDMPYKYNSPPAENPTQSPASGGGDLSGRTPLPAALPTRVFTARRTQQIADPTRHCPTPTGNASHTAAARRQTALRPRFLILCDLPFDISSSPPSPSRSRLSLSLSHRRPHAAARDTDQRPGVRRRQWRLWGRGVLR
jgi:hypothetical protein